MAQDNWRKFLSRDTHERVVLDIPTTSLLFPPGKVRTQPAGDAVWQADIGLDDLVVALVTDRRYTPFVRRTLAALVADAEVIAWRQAVFADFLDNPVLVEKVAALLPQLASLREGNVLLGGRTRSLLLETSDRLAELDLYTEVVQTLHDSLTEANLHAEALVTLRDDLAVLLRDEHFKDLRAQLPDLRAPLQDITSLTVGINLDLQLQPVSAVLLAINDYRLTEQVSLLERLIGTRREDGEESGIAPLHYVSRDRELRKYDPLFQDLNDLMTRVAQPIAQALKRYVKTSGGTLSQLEHEFAFFVAAAGFVRRLESLGVTLCRPEAAPAAERVTQVDGLLNASLVLRTGGLAVASDVTFDGDGRIAVLTGPNSGGKTTYLQAVGLAQVLFQAGLYLPAKSARMSPVDAILTHFPALETREQGRLAEEAARLRMIFQRATENSLMLLNETFSSTTSGEAIFLARDVLCGMRVIGVRAVFATHLVELAEMLPEMEKSVDGDSAMCSLVAGVRLTDESEIVPTYEIERGTPHASSYAREIARRHGISLEQIVQSHNGRGRTTPRDD